MGFGRILGNIVDAVTGGGKDDANTQNNPNDQAFDSNAAYDQGDQGDILPASMDPLGDPADAPYQNADGDILPASMDPMGDPADDPRYANAAYDQGDEGDILPASMDPLGDPADQRS